MRRILSGMLILFLVCGCNTRPDAQVPSAPEVPPDPPRKPAAGPLAPNEVKLPGASSAKAISELIVLNVTSKGQVLLSLDDREDDIGTLDNAAQVEGYMKRRAVAEKLKTKKDKLEATPVLRIDKETPFGKTYAIMKACALAGYEKYQLRVMRRPDGTEGQITLSFPRFDKKGKFAAEGGVVEEQPKHFIVRVVANETGQIAKLDYRETSAADECGFSFGVDLEAYQKKFKAIADIEKWRIEAAAAKRKIVPQPRIYLQPGDKLLQDSVVQVLDASLQAGFTDILLLPIGPIGTDVAEKDK